MTDSLVPGLPDRGELRAAQWAFHSPEAIWPAPTNYVASG